MNLLDQLLFENNNMGYSAPGDPGVVGDGLVSPGAYDRALGALGSYGKTAFGKALGTTGLGLAMGMPSEYAVQSLLGGLMSPGSVLGAISAPVQSALGVAPTGFMGKLASMAAPVAASMIGGPIAGAVTGVLGNFGIDGLMDGLDMRSDEKVRDKYEGDWGYFGGRQAYGDRKGIMSQAQTMREALPNSVASLRAVDEAIARVQAMEAAMHNRMGTENPNLSAANRAPTYGGMNSLGGPMGGLAGGAYGPSMGGWAGLGIGNPSSYGGSNGASGAGSDRDKGGYAGHAGDKDGSNTGFGR